MSQHTGKRLGSYQILEQIGQGGMGTIFKAYQPSVDRYVAIKVLPIHFTKDATFMARFHQEARTLAHLEHPHILPIYDHGEQQGITYLVMRYIQTGTLKDLITQRGDLDLDQATRIMGQVGRALGYAHEQGIIHRDIKPSNVMIDEQGNTFLADFGIAKLVAGTTQLTASGSIVGTPAYMSPEQGMGQPLDHRCDIYALGIMLYEMVTGRVPFDAETPLAILMQHVNAPLPLPRQVKPDLPEAVERVILKALAKLPGDRFQTAEEMVETLEKAVAGIPIEITLPERPVGGPTAVISQPAEPIEPPSSYKPIAKTKIKAPARRPIPWLPIVGVTVLAAVIIAALLILPNIGRDQVETTSTLEMTVATPAAPELVSGMGQLPPEWTNYSNGNFCRALARQGDYLWIGGDGGLVRWDLNDHSYVKFGLARELPSNHVNDLLVDGEGNLWVATGDGLNRFDGQTWHTFDEFDGLDSNEVKALLLDNDGVLWAGTDGERGLNVYDGNSWGPPSLPPLPFESSEVHLLVMEKNHNLWAGVADDGLAYFDGSDWNVFTSEDGLPDNYVQDLLLADDGTVWVSSDDGVVRRDPETGDWEAIPQLEDVSVYAMHQVSDGSFWFAGKGQVIHYDPELGDWQPFESRPGALLDQWVISIIEDERGLWFGSDGDGAIFYDGNNWETWATDDGLSGNDIYDILQDESGALWFIHDDGNGLSRYDPASDTWQTFGNDEGALDWPSALGLDSEGNLWIGGYEGLERYDGQTWQDFEPDPLAGVGSIHVIAFGPDDVQWLWTDAGLIRHDPASDDWATFNTDDHPALESLTAVYIADDGVVWAGGDYGLVGYDGNDWNTPTVADDGTPIGDEHGDVHGITEAPDGSVWVVADGDLYRLDDGQWSRFNWPDNYASTLAVGPDGDIWVGDYHTLGRFDPASGVWQTFTTDDGLVHCEVYAIHVTPDGVVWIGTDGGVSRYTPGE